MARALILALAAVLGLAGRAEALDVPFTAFQYAQPIVTPQEGGGLLVETGARPGGYGRRWALSPDRTYALTVAGARTAGVMTLRVRRGMGGYEYVPAPARGAVVTVTGVSGVEALVYADAPAGYRLDRLDVRECPDCPTDAALARGLLDRLPGLSTALRRGDQLTAARLLLPWAARQATFAGSADELLPPLDYGPAAFIAQNLAPGVGGVFCAGAADLYVGLLRLFGIEAFRVDLGPPGVEHSTVIVSAGVASRPRDLYVLDPTFALDLSRSRGDDVPLRSLLARARHGQSGGFTAGPVGRRVLVGDELQDCRTHPAYTPCSLDAYLAGYGEQLRGYGLRRDALLIADELLRTPVRIWRPAGSSAERAFAGQLASARAGLG